MKAKQAVVWSLGATGTVVVVGKAVKGEWPSPSILLGIAVVYVILGFAADIAPQVATPFAVLVFLAVLLAIGTGALEGVAASASNKKRKKNLRVIQGGRKGA